MAESPNRTWLRKLLEDTPRVATETATADGNERSFYVSHELLMLEPPPTVLVDGVVQVREAGDYTITAERDGIILSVKPVVGTIVNVRYFHQSWEDDELDIYLAAAANMYSDDQEIVYAAAIFAIDTLLVGASTALNFGAGAESFDMVSIFNRLVQLRAVFQQHLDANLSSGLLIQEVFLDYEQPDIGGWGL